MQRVTHPSDVERLRPNVVVMYGRGRSLDLIDRGQSLELMREYGAVVFRGFGDVDGASFMRLTERFCYHFLEHASVEYRPSRNEDGTVAEVVIGNDSVALHGEMYYAPVRPDSLWFHCTSPARKGGATTVADSRSVLAALSDRTRRAFETKRIVYRHRRPRADWERIAKMSDRDEVISTVNLLPDTVATAVGADDIQIEFTADAVRPTGFDGQPGFLNSIENMLEYADRSGTIVTFEDGETFDADMLADIARAGQSCTQDVDWQPNDVLLVDNTRLMHGRRSFEGNERRIDARFGLLITDEE